MTSVAELESHFSSRLSVCSDCVALVNGDAVETVAALNSARLELGQLKNSVKIARVNLANWRTSLQRASELVQLMSKSQVRSVAQSLPSSEFLPKNRAKPVAAGKTAAEAKETKSSNANASKPTVNVAPSSLNLIPYLTMNEFEEVPKYMKGRLRYENMREAVDEFNSALETKYKFLGKGFQAMASISDKKKFKEMRALETRETKGMNFLVSEDFKTSNYLKSEANRRNIFTILRHCQRIREIRGPETIVRYSVLPPKL